MRRQPYAEAAGGAALDPSVPQVAVCPTCKTVLDFDTDGNGCLVERCPKCHAPRKRPNPAAALPTLPPIQEGELRCQLCAQGVGLDRPTARFCKGCVSARRAPAGLKHSKVPIERSCACGATFVSKGGTMCKRCREAARKKAHAEYHTRVRAALAAMAPQSPEPKRPARVA